MYNPFADMLTTLLRGGESVLGLPDRFRNMATNAALMPGNAMQSTLAPYPRMQQTLGVPAPNSSPSNLPGAPGSPYLGPPNAIGAGAIGAVPAPGAPASATNPPAGQLPGPASGAPAGSVRQAGPPSSGAATNTPGSGGGFGGDPIHAGMIRYPTDNPQYALESAILDMGGNPFRADPYMSLMRNSAPGLMAAFALGNLGTTSAQMNGAGGEGDMFGAYLRGVLGSNNGIGSALSGAMSSLPAALRQLTALQDQIAGTGQSLADVNPFAQYIADIMAQAGSASSLYGSLATPFMSSKVGRSYMGGLEDVAGMALRRRAADVRQSSNPRNFWDYLFPGL